MGARLHEPIEHVPFLFFSGWGRGRALWGVGGKGCGGEQGDEFGGGEGGEARA